MSLLVLLVLGGAVGLTLVILLIAVVVVVARRGAGAAPAVREWLAAGATVVYVRSRAEFAAGHYPAARHIPVDELAGRLAELGDRTRPVVLYCRSGGRAGVAARLLRQAGFTAVHNAGGLSQMPPKESVR